MSKLDRAAARVQQKALKNVRAGAGICRQLFGRASDDMVFPVNVAIAETICDALDEQDAMIASQAAEIERLQGCLADANCALTERDNSAEDIASQAALIQSMRNALEHISNFSFPDTGYYSGTAYARKVASAALAKVSASPKDGQPK